MAKRQTTWVTLLLCWSYNNLLFNITAKKNTASTVLISFKSLLTYLEIWPIFHNHFEEIRMFIHFLFIQRRYKFFRRCHEIRDQGRQQNFDQGPIFVKRYFKGICDIETRRVYTIIRLSLKIKRNSIYCLGILLFMYSRRKCMMGIHRRKITTCVI